MPPTQFRWNDEIFFGQVILCFRGKWKPVSHKVAAAVVAVRRSGGSATLDCLYHFLTYAEMIVATSNYWNVIHGRTPNEVSQDGEGVQIMRVLGKNMVENSNSEPGCFVYRLYQEVGNPQSFIFYEVYENQDAVNIHNTSEHFQTFIEQVSELASDKPQVDVF